ncbi:amino acid/amide ABC transporter membrane protein 1 (HAAT family) [Acidovorax sp. 69]|uniref:branched-chain amino acid ABC transporter permease n=1 Tax=Acidovorax sp. 69 TaxID=2035202 RepID=UPI000C23E25B|nr:branched-chain amino acid ABC transporter permease [Acidovorax sp. 69]PJI98482.1 amino acid/amide ABC transporter membrane protein 1 (HAAT family) [Acidovorax sp. 69]
MNFLDVLLAGATLGGLYGLVAMGLTLQYGVARIMNLSYGEFLIAPAFLTYVLVSQFGLSPLWVLVLAIPLGFAVQWLVYQLLLTPLVRRTGAGPALEVDSILATFGLLFVVQGAMLVVFGGNYYSYEYLSVPIHVLGSTVAANRLLVLVVAVLVGGGLYALLTRTRMGTVVRAVSVAPRFAQLVGINVRQTSALAFGMGGALVAVSGVLVSMFLPFSASMGTMFAMKALIVVIMGGVGNLMGCLMAGLLLGFAETLVASFVDPGLTLAVNFGLFLLVLLFRPTGLFGKAAR